MAESAVKGSVELKINPLADSSAVIDSQFVERTTNTIGTSLLSLGPDPEWGVALQALQESDLRLLDWIRWGRSVFLIVVGALHIQYSMNGGSLC